MMTDMAGEGATDACSSAIGKAPRSGPPASVTNDLPVGPRRPHDGRRGIRIGRRAVPPRPRPKGILPSLRRHHTRGATRAPETYGQAAPDCAVAEPAQGCAAGGPGE